MFREFARWTAVVFAMMMIFAAGSSAERQPDRLGAYSILAGICAVIIVGLAGDRNA